MANNRPLASGCLACYFDWRRGGAGGLVVLAGFKPVAGRREAAWVGSIPTRLRQKEWRVLSTECLEESDKGNGKYKNCVRTDGRRYR